jgi:hypothetical protein
MRGARGGRKENPRRSTSLMGLPRARVRPFPTASRMFRGIGRWSTWGSAPPRRNSRRRACGGGGGGTGDSARVRPDVC